MKMKFLGVMLVIIGILAVILSGATESASSGIVGSVGYMQNGTYVTMEELTIGRDQAGLEGANIFKGIGIASIGIGVVVLLIGLGKGSDDNDY